MEIAMSERMMAKANVGCDGCVRGRERRDHGVCLGCTCNCGEGYVYADKAAPQPTPDTPTLDEWESAMEGKSLVAITSLAAATGSGHLCVAELVDSDGRRCARFVAANGYCYNDPIIRRKPQTTTINFDRPTFAAVGAQFVASGTPGQQPPKGSAWLSVASIVHGGIWMANSSGQQFMTTWDQLSVGGYVYTSDHGATWHACNRTVTKGA
jgi:hypothetical protein